jgi:hypothetical protein
MRSPIRPIPEAVERWVGRARLLRWLDALAGWILLWGSLAGWPGSLPGGRAALVALLLIGALALVSPLRQRWRLASAAAGLWISRSLAVGDLAWRVGPTSAERVIVTGRRGARVTVAALSGDAAEGLTVRRTRVLLVPS